jgi:nicotinate-nucleotide pyrophosphorylase (carboxylating)
MINNKFDNIITACFDEDMPYGDITTESVIKDGTVADGYFIAKDDGIICGTEIAKRVFELAGGNVILDLFVKDGDEIKKGQKIAHVKGDAKSILRGERTALNLMQRTSGIATATNKAIKAVEGTNAKITDTRKTMPGLRILDKFAVKVGGGYNHRTGLSDGILIKDNHIAAAGGIKNAVEAARKSVPHTLKIEVETENFEQIKEALEAKADIIMLDNMSIEDMRKAVLLIDGKAITEASGNMGERDLKAVAQTGVDIISIGALTHSVKALDISLKFSIIN